MKNVFLATLAFFLFSAKAFSQISFQDTTFTDPVYISFAPDFVSFTNCRFLGISGTALTIEGSGALISNCRFENIEGTAVSAFASEVYLVEDTIRNVLGVGVDGQLGAVVLIGTQISQVTETAVSLSGIEVGELTDCSIFDVGAGAICQGGGEAAEMLVSNSNFFRINGLPNEMGGGHAISAELLATVRVLGCSIDSCMGWGVQLQNIGSANTGTDNVEIQGNHISRTVLGGIFGDENTFHAVIRSNEISYPGFINGIPDIAEHCIDWAGLDARIEENKLHHALGFSFSGLPLFASNGIYLRSSATVARNLIHNCTGNGILYSEDAFADGAQLAIFNNIIFDVEGSPVFLSADNGNIFAPAQTFVRNNTLHAKHTFGLNPEALLGVSAMTKPIIAEGNLLVYEGVSDVQLYIQTFVGGGLVDNLNLKSPSDPGFVDFAGRDFHLASEDSPAHNFLPANFGLPNDDFDGELRLGLRDAGADELPSAANICGCNNCPDDIPELFFKDFSFGVVAADNNNLASPGQGVCGVRVEFEHEYLGDLTMSLISPSGQSVQLIGAQGFWGGTEATNWNVGFVPCGDSANPDPGFSATWSNDQPWGAGANYTGIYYPAAGCLEDFNMGSVIGDWVLRVSDNQSDDTGLIRGFEVVFCDTAGVSCFLCSGPPIAQFIIQNAGPWGATIVNQSSGGVSSLEINFGDGQMISGPPNSYFHQYENAGNYLVRLIARNDCGADTFYQISHIAGALPIAFAFAEPTVGCSPLQVQTFIADSDHVDSWHWLFPGGTPSESFETEPVVVYGTGGSFEITLIVSNEVGSDTISNVAQIEVLQSIENLSFSTEVVGDSIVCTNQTQHADFFFWTLDGGNPIGMNTSPFVFEVNAPGVYTVGLFAANVCDTLFLEKTVSVINSGNVDLEQQGWRFAATPNPTSGSCNLTISSPENLPADILVLNALGQTVLSRHIEVSKGENQYLLDLQQLSSGAYQLNIQTSQGRKTLKLIKS